VLLVWLVATGLLLLLLLRQLSLKMRHQSWCLLVWLLLLCHHLLSHSLLQGMGDI
jgi:hypothetical protein